MAAPLKQDRPTGNPKRLLAVLVLLLIIGGTLAFATTLPPRPDASSAPTVTETVSPQVEGAQSDTAPASESVPPKDTKPATTPTTNAPQITYPITYTVDGDTVKASIDGKTETIRLIGVDTPETKDPRKKVQCFGQVASEYTKSALLNKEVQLVPDASQDNRDKYGRLLRYIFLKDGTNFNEKLVADGYAYEYTYRIPYEYQKLFKADQTAAETAQKGLWAPATCNGLR